MKTKLLLQKKTSDNQTSQVKSRGIPTPYSSIPVNQSESKPNSHQPELVLDDEATALRRDVGSGVL